MLVLGFDVEANGRRELFIPSGKDKETRWEREVTEIHCIVTRNLVTDEVKRFVSNPTVVSKCDGSLMDGWAYLMSADLLIAHNGIDYDMPVLRRLQAPADHVVENEPPVIDTIVWSKFLYPDLMSHPNMRFIKGSTAGGPNALEAWGRRLKCFKGEFKGPWDRLTQKMLDYCVQDTNVLLAIYRHLLPKMKKWKAHSKFELAVARIISEQSCNGITFNMPEAEKFWQHLVESKAGLTDTLRQRFPAPT